MKRRYQTHNGFFAASISALAAVAVVAPVSVAPAQEVIRRVSEPRWSIFDMFTPRRDRVIRRLPDAPARRQVERPRPRTTAAPKPRKPKSRVVSAPRSASATAAAAVAAKPEVVAVEKKPDARTVLVIGDFMAGGLAEALQENFVQNANVRVLDRTNGSSGFVRQDVYNWPKEIGSIIDAEKPAAIVVMMGSNDRQSMQVAGSQESPRSDAWTKEYQLRTSALGETIEARKVPLLWVSVPAFKSPKMTSDMLAFNTIFKASAEAGGGQFVDVWDGFVDENGQFVTTGPDVNGQPVRLRGRDGINLTSAGKEKLAFYVDKPLRKILGETDNNGVAPAVVTPALPPASAKPIAVDRTDPIALDDPGIDGGTELLGAPGTLPGDPANNANVAPSGRADSFQSSSRPAAPVVEPADTASRPAIIPPVQQ